MHSQITTPVIGHAFVERELSLFEIRETIGPTAKRWFQSILSEVACTPVVFREDVHVDGRTRKRIPFSPLIRLNRNSTSYGPRISTDSKIDSTEPMPEPDLLST